MEHIYRPRGVCTREMRITVSDGVVKSVIMLGGCQGNTKGISKLVEGMKVSDVIERLSGITCGFKPTSCPNELAKALKEITEAEK